MDIVRFDYYPAKSQNVTGADLLQLDLAELEATRLAGVRETVPVRHTFSLARDFPLEFARLKQTGRCSFQTREARFREAYPGTYGHRVIAVTPTVDAVEPAPPLRALLSNHGLSLITRREDEEPHVSLRAPDALPFSEFRLRDDMGVYGLPGEALMTFEGSGVETLWGIEYSPSLDPRALASAADVLLTFDVRAHYSPALHAAFVPPGEVERTVLAGAAAHQPKALEALRGAPTQAVFDFDLTALGLPAQEVERRVKNVVLVVSGPDPLPAFEASLASFKPGASPAGPGAEFPVVDGVALSNAPPFKADGAPSPLNVFVGKDADRVFRLTIDKDQNPGVDFSGVTNVVLGVEYSATIPVVA